MLKQCDTEKNKMNTMLKGKQLPIWSGARLIITRLKLRLTPRQAAKATGHHYNNSAYARLHRGGRLLAGLVTHHDRHPRQFQHPILSTECRVRHRRKAGGEN
jgi:vacuolar-type H+-ATPase subunit B/Vma2